MKEIIKERLYNLMDSFLVEGDKPRPIERLNQDRHLFIKNVLELLKDNREKAYQKGFIDGSNSTAIQSKEIHDCKLKDILKTIEKIDVSGGGSGRRLKIQLTAYLEQLLKP